MPTPSHCGVTVALAAAGAFPNPVCRPGSVICHGNMIFRHPAPSSMEVLKKLVLSVGPNQALGDSDIHVDLHSLAVGGKLPSGMWVHELHRPHCEQSKSTANQILILSVKERVRCLGW